MIKMLFVSAVAVASWLLMGKEFSNIAYYDKDFPVSGNIEYLQKQCKLDLRIPDKEKNFPTYFRHRRTENSAKVRPTPSIKTRKRSKGLNLP